jgi:hypothetical protein
MGGQLLYLLAKGRQSCHCFFLFFLFFLLLLLPLSAKIKQKRTRAFQTRQPLNLPKFPKNPNWSPNLYPFPFQTILGIASGTIRTNGAQSVPFQRVTHSNSNLVVGAMSPSPPPIAQSVSPSPRANSICGVPSRRRRRRRRTGKVGQPTHFALMQIAHSPKTVSSSTHLLSGGGQLIGIRRCRLRLAGWRSRAKTKLAIPQ